MTGRPAPAPHPATTLRALLRNLADRGCTVAVQDGRPHLHEAGPARPGGRATAVELAQLRRWRWLLLAAAAYPAWWANVRALDDAQGQRHEETSARAATDGRSAPARAPKPQGEAPAMQGGEAPTPPWCAGCGTPADSLDLLGVPWCPHEGPRPSAADWGDEEARIDDLLGRLLDAVPAATSRWAIPDGWTGGHTLRVCTLCGGTTALHDRAGSPRHVHCTTRKGGERHGR